jgi:hypothetical protein
VSADDSAVDDNGESSLSTPAATESPTWPEGQRRVAVLLAMAMFVLVVEHVADERIDLVGRQGP